jgi:NAD(P)-dependent dehydrogenase (short-subunit alcohol dehydrogenase family)
MLIRLVTEEREHMSSNSLAGKTAIVTGASSGLGATFARALAGAGASVVVVARRAERLEALARDIVGAGGTALAVACDVGDPVAVEAMVERAYGQFRRIDVLVNAAGIAADGGMAPEKVPAALFEQTIRVNVLGLWYCCQQAATHMLRDGGGSIINIASIAGLTGVRDFPPAYQASKAAVINLTRSLACSWGDRGVRVNALAPGWFPSEMTDQLFAIPGFKEWASESAPMQRVGDPAELTGALLFLATDASSFVTGQTLAIDGGASAGTRGTPASVRQFFRDRVPHGLGESITPDDMPRTP